jgi:hypothetical protein
MTSLTRRSLLAGAGFAGGWLTLAAQPGSAQPGSAQPGSARAATAGIATDGGAAWAPGAARASKVSAGTTLVHGDLHNHTLISDGDGDPALAFESIRASGLDVAALTDHTTPIDVNGVTRTDWDRTGELADAADDPGRYTALRGFEWSHPMLGHLNVWYTGDFVDLSACGSLGKLYRWIGRTGGISSFNHPGREPLRFHEFGYDPRMLEQMVGLEIFNQRDDFLFDGWARGQSSPLNACLNAGWRTGLTGVTDEHGDDWGRTEGKGRTGLWVTENTRNGVLAAMRARRFFATRVSGLRLDATADGVRMGGSLPKAKGDVRFEVDLDRGADWSGRPLHVQVLRPGSRAPEVADVIAVEAGRTAAFTVPLDLEDGPWVVLRVSDPTRASASPGPDGHPGNDWGVAYSSPWWLTADAG